MIAFVINVLIFVCNHCGVSQLQQGGDDADCQQPCKPSQQSLGLSHARTMMKQITMDIPSLQLDQTTAQAVQSMCALLVVD